ncbi:MAG: CBS domain-containing protein [Gammaproteobacteria bacterium]|nr:CBS domain-containing protein [Gammaproteobacteria bacterium]
MLVDDVMTREVKFLNPGQTISDAVAELAKHDISGAPVVDPTGVLAGIITEKDILNAVKNTGKKLEMVYPSLSMVSVTFIETMEEKETMEAFKEIANTKVSDIMTKAVTTVQSGSKLALVVNLIILKGVNRIPVMDGGKVIGIISRADIIQGLAKSNILK